MNTFGTSSLQIPLCDPRPIIVARNRFKRIEIPELLEANSFCCSRTTSKGYILVRREDFVRLDSYSTALQLTVGTLVLKNLSIIQAQCVSRGLAADANALYLVELTDGRGILKNRWFQFPLNAQYNVRSPAYPQEYYSESSGTWTWSTMAGDIWSRMSAFLGSYPGLPITPVGSPENWKFCGVSAFDALCSILTHLGMSIACDLTQDNPFTVVYNDATDTAFDTLTERYAKNLEDDFEWIDLGSGRVPKTIIVYFRLRNAQYGQEETVRRDAHQESSTPYYPVTVTAPARFANAVGTHFLHSDFTIRQDIDGVADATDVTTATTIADDLVTKYYASIHGANWQRISRIYAGALPFATGSKVSEVKWTNGWKTHVMLGV